MGRLKFTALLLLFLYNHHDIAQDYGLTTYGEACIDSCKQRGFPFTWCHKTKSRNGTFVGISYDDDDDGDDDANDEEVGDDDDVGFPANSPHDKIPHE